jgi:dihydroxy-acid dehydratase
MRDARGHGGDEGGGGGDAALVPTAVSRHPRLLVGHVALEAVTGGPIALVAEGDRILIDATAHTIDLLVDAAELERRRTTWKPMEPRYTSGFLAKYAKLAQGAERGAITNL